MLDWVRGRLAAKLALAAVAIALAVDGIGIWELEEAAVAEMRRLSTTEARTVATVIETRLDAELSAAARVPARLAAVLARGWIGRQSLEQQLCAVLEVNPAVYGTTVALEPGGFEAGAPALAPYCYRVSDGVALRDLAREEYQLESQAWFRLGRDGGQPAWTAPYFDEGGGEALMVTRVVPVRRPGDASVVGVATADVALGWLDAFVRALPVSTTGHAFLLGPDDVVLGHPLLAPGGPAPRLGALPGLASSTPYVLAIRAVVAGEAPTSRDVIDPRDGRPGWLTAFPLERTGWHAVLFFPEADTAESTIAFRRRLLLGSLAGGVLLALAMAALARTIVQPVAALARATGEVAAGRLDAPLPRIRSADEVGRLARSFGDMQQALVRHVERERQTAVDQERLEGELRIASRIQLSLIPSATALDAVRLGCDVHGVLDPARAVGGDLYDVVRRDDGSLCFLIGDVSDKGIPAALLMAVTHTLFGAVARQPLAPEQVLATINDALAAQNAADMFVTLQCGVLDLASGRLRLASGGHTRPALLVAGQPPRLLEGELGTVVGVVEGLAFPVFEAVLAPGDALVLYSDGVTEAHDPQSRLFGEERLLACLVEAPRESAEGLASAVYGAVQAFAAGREPFDDIALLVVRRPARPATLEIAPEVARIAEASAWLADFCRSEGVADDVRHDLDLALDELLANVIDHGAPPAGSRLRLSLEALPDRVRLELRDRGTPFDPRARATVPDAAGDGAGGLGLELLHRAVDVVDYASVDGENRLLIEKRRTTPGAKPGEGGR